VWDLATGQRIVAGDQGGRVYILSLVLPAAG
jgi:hypothetical protein